MNDRMARWTAAMRQERYEDAWVLAALTLAERDPAKRDNPSLPYHLRWVWDGRALDGRDVLVRCYHGLGDTLMFARFLPLLVQRAASVTVEVQPALLGLVASAVDGITLVPFDVARPLPPADIDVEIMELDFALRVAASATVMPYLRAAPAALPPGTIALCQTAGDWDPERTIDPALFAPLCGRAPCVVAVPGPSALDVLNPQGCSLDIGETAALIAAADLVITVDTMVAHLAGALGRPTWVLVKAEPDWRWPRMGSRSAWYPATRVYHQPTAGDWAAVLAQVERDLATRVALRTQAPAR